MNQESTIKKEVLKKAKQDLKESAEDLAWAAANSENTAKNKSRYRDMICIVEESYLRKLMLECEGNQTLAAKQSGLNRGTIRSKLDQYNLL